MPTSEFTDDGFLNNRLKVLQPRKGYRAGLDAVMVAAAVPAKSGDHIFEAGIGTGIASLCLAKRVPDIQVTGVENNPEYAALAGENAARNNFGESITILDCDMADLSKHPQLAPGLFDHAFANPPYREAGRIRQPDDKGRRAAFVSNMAMIKAWMETMLDLVRPGGTVTMILPVELDDAFRNFPQVGKNHLKVLPMVPREGENPIRVIFQIEKGNLPGIEVITPLALHERDGCFTDAADTILREVGGLMHDH